MTKESKENLIRDHYADMLHGATSPWSRASKIFLHAHLIYRDPKHFASCKYCRNLAQEAENG